MSHGIFRHKRNLRLIEPYTRDTLLPLSFTIRDLSGSKNILKRFEMSQLPDVDAEVYSIIIDRDWLDDLQGYYAGIIMLEEDVPSSVRLDFDNIEGLLRRPHEQFILQI